MQNSTILPIFPNDFTETFSVFSVLSDIAKFQDRCLLSALAGLDVNPAQYSYLFALCNSYGLNLGELAKKLHVEKSTASVTIKRMETAGLVERKIDENDSRMIRLIPTSLGLTQFQRAKLIVSDYISKIFKNFNQGEITLLYDMLCGVRENIQQYQHH